MVSSGKTLDLFAVLEQERGDGQRTVDRESGAVSGHPPSTIHHPPSTAEPAQRVSPTLVRSPAAFQRASRHSWLAIFLPQLSLEALRDADDAAAEPVQRPLVVIESEGSAKHVLACNAEAARSGIVPGIGLNAAYALTSDLAVAAREPRLEQRLLERLATWSGQFTPRVSLAPPDGLLLEVKGSLRLFGGAESLLSRVETGLAASGVEATVALAPSSLAAIWLARAGERSLIMSPTALAARLASLPLSCPRWPEPVWRSLQNMGVQTIGDCLRLPRDGFARRFGAELLDELDRSLARAPEVHRSFLPRERFVWRRDFEFELENVAQLETALEPAIEELAGFLRSRQAGVQGCELKLRHRASAVTRFSIRLVVPASDASHFRGLLGSRLERLALRAPVRGATLRSAPLLPLPAAQADLGMQPDGDDEDRIPRLLERLCMRLGSRAVYGVSVIAEHRPERAWRKLPGAAVTRHVRCPDIVAVAPRPSWLLTEAQRLDVEDGWPHYEGRLVIEQGPERIESGWWDGDDVARDYYIARTPQGLRLWIYRERRADHRWFLHGIFG